mmetsp:Transcript_10123/g.15053  ORF Transcript_10123/g.15053 Transcript_10123/m.15053 type:complete len:487 (-) Transcript_10123:97-1557(-)
MNQKRQIAKTAAILLIFSCIAIATASDFGLVQKNNKVPSLPSSLHRRANVPENKKHVSNKNPLKNDVRGGDGGTATIPNEIFNLVKSIVGAGVLSLPAGIAAFGNAPSAILPAVSLIGVIGAVAAYDFSLIGRVCSYTGAVSYRDAWDKTVGTDSSWLPATFKAFNCLAANLAYSMILADTFKDLFSTFGLDVSRTNALLGVSTLVILPLCLMKNLSSLAPFSLLGIAGMGYLALAMAVRYFGGDYSMPDGKFVQDVAAELQPVFGDKGASSVLHPSSFILICMLSTAYLAHFNAPNFYNELIDNTVARFNTVTYSSFAISILIFGIVASLGFLTFGSASSGLILNNYSTNDTLMTLSRVAVALSIVFSYPLVFVGTRDGILDLANVPQENRNNAMLNNHTFVLIGILTALALKVKDLSFVLSFAGATMGNALIYVFPALMFRSAVKNMDGDVAASLKGEVNFAMFAAVLGVVMGAIGVKMALDAL